MQQHLPASTSRRITALRALLILTVLGVHSLKGVRFHLGSITPAADVFFTVLAFHIFQVCVPLYFAIAGYLLFLRYDGGLRGYPQLVVKRFRSVLLPFLLLNAIWICYLILVGGIPGIGGTTVYKTRGFLSLLLGIDGLPLIYPLWFLRDLFIYFLLAPLFGLCFRSISWMGLALLWAAWNSSLEQTIHVNLIGPFFFYLGGIVARKRCDLNGWQRFRWILLLAWAALIAASSFVRLELHGSFWREPLWNAALLAGACSTWTLSGLPQKKNGGPDDQWEGVGSYRTLLALAPYAFFIYLLHEPVMSFLMAATPGLAIAGNTASQIGYAAFLTIATGLVNLSAAWLLRRFVPGIYAVVTGGR